MKTKVLKSTLSFSLVLTLLLSVLLFAPTVSAATYTANMQIRIGLYFTDSTGDNSVTTIKNSCADGFELGAFDSASKIFTAECSTPLKDIQLIAENGAISVYTYGKDTTGADLPHELLYTGTKFYLHPAAGSLLYIGGQGYAGLFEYSLTPDGKIQLINIISLEEYVKSVLPYEFIASWNDEALKAGAIVIRTYALSSIMGRHPDGGFDVCATTHCQVYRGMSGTTAKSNAAVDATAGIIATYKGKPATTVYHSSSIDATESVSDAWGSSQTAFPYLDSVKTPFVDGTKIPGGLWHKIIRPAELLTYLSTKYPGELSDEIAAVTYEKADTGYVNQMTVSDTAGGSVSVRTSGNVRSLLTKYVRSACFDLVSTFIYSDSSNTNAATADSAADKVTTVLTANGTEEAEGSQTYTILSADGKKTVGGVEKVFYVDGKGYGHGIGLSQYGAQQLAQKGYTYQQIIDTYYPGLKLETLPSAVDTDE